MTLFQRLCLVLANLILLMHAAFVTFVLVGLVLIWVGWCRNWAFVRNFWFRIAHLSAIGVVAAESLLGFVCPLTTWENNLRREAGDPANYTGSFIEHWVHRFLFFDLGDRVFTIIYVGFFLTVALSFWLVPPRRQGTSRV
jgi:hypothetical protein